ncbi:MAG: hypothetical protein O6850_02015, partial [Acidobacteria bacterium]|nr:hypothetical protein [Acidobacteriota bacterium]
GGGSTGCGGGGGGFDPHPTAMIITINNVLSAAALRFFRSILKSSFGNKGYVLLLGTQTTEISRSPMNLDFPEGPNCLGI